MAEFHSNGKFPGEHLIQLVKTHKSYLMGHGTVHALKEVDLTISSGEMVAIMGPSGSGKSTLMHLLGCLDRPTSGRYYFNGKDISTYDDRTLSHLRATSIGFVFQSFNLIPQLNVYENVEVPFLYRDRRLAKDRDSILSAIERVGLKHRVHHRPSQLSGGEMQRVAIARALAINPLLVLADEPTGNLDSETGETILKLFQDLNVLGVTIILVTHDPKVADHCKRTLRMRDGRLMADSEADQL